MLSCFILGAGSLGEEDALWKYSIQLKTECQSLNFLFQKANLSIFILIGRSYYTFPT